MIENRDQKIILIVDNSEYSPFVPLFEKLNLFGASIYHHYGFVYGQAVGKQCTSFVTFHPNLMVESSVAPNCHDHRWGMMETQ